MSEPQAPSPRSRRRRVWIGLGILLGVALATLPWWIDDLVRSLVARGLASALDAEVTLDRLVFEASDRVLLEGLTLSRPGLFPPVERLKVGRLTLEAELRPLLGGQARHLRVEEAEVDLVPGRWPDSSDPSPLRYPRLDLEETRVTIRSDRGVTSLTLSGELSDDGSGPRGRIRVKAQTLDLAPILDLLTEASPPELQLLEWSGRIAELDASVEVQETVEAAEIHLDHLAVKDSEDQGLTLDTVLLELTPDGSRDAAASPPGPGLPQRLHVGAQHLAAEAVGVRIELDALDATASLSGGPVPTSVEGSAQDLVVHRLPAEPLPPGTEGAPSPIRVERLRLSFAPDLDTPGPSAGPGPTPATWRGSLASADVHLPTDPGSPEQHLTSARVDWVVTVLDPALGAEGPLHIEADADLPGVESTRLEATVDPQGTVQDLGLEWRGLRLERFLPWFEPRLAGSRGPCHGTVALGPASLVAVIELPGLEGTLPTPSGPRAIPTELFPARLEIDSGRPGLDPALAGTAELSTALGKFEIGGRLALGSGVPIPGVTSSGSASSSFEGTWTWRGEPLERLLPPMTAFLDISPPIELAGRLAVQGSVAGTLADPIVQARLDLGDLRVSTTASSNEQDQLPELVDGALRLDLAMGPGEALRFETLELDGSVLAAGFEPLPASLMAKGLWKPAEAAAGGASGTGADLLAVDAWTLEIADAQLTGSLKGSPTVAAAGWRGEVELATLDLAAVVDRAETPPLPGFEVRGQLAGAFEITEAEGALEIAGPWNAEGLGFQSDDGARVLEGLAGSGRLEGRWHPSEGWRAETRVEASGFLLLWDTLFADFSTAAPVLETRIEGNAAGLQQALIELEATTDTRLKANFDAADPKAPPWTVGFEALDLEALHRDLLLPGLGAERVGEALAGRVHGVLAGHLDSADTWSLQGDLEVENLSLRRGEQSASGVNLELPIDLARNEGEVTGQRRTGWLVFETLASGPFELPAVSTELWTEGDALGLEASLEVPLYGGAVRIERLTLDDLLGSAPALVAGLAIEGLDLAAIAEAYEVLPLEGTLEGHLPRLRLADTEQGSVLTVEGGGEMRLFDGVVRVHGITGRELLSPFPRITLSADLESIDLGQFTRKIDFGEMTGILEGSIQDCELFRGVPVTCRAHLETVERRGVRRTVDVKAVNNLTILGTGQGNLFDRGLRRFFKRFTYDKLLLDLELANDVLLLRGQPMRGDREAFLSGRLPFPIEVVNAQPGRTVSFEAMRRRLESLDFEGVTTSP